MRKIVLKDEGGNAPRDTPGMAVERLVTLVFPETGAEYERAVAAVDAWPQLPGGRRPGGRDGAGRVTPAPAGGWQAPDDGRYVVTSDLQRRAWDLPDLADAPTARDAAPGEADATDGPEAVPVVDPADAVDLLFENDGGRSDETAEAAEGDSGADAVGARPCGRARPSPVVNLKHNRGPIPDDVRAAFRELCGQRRIDALLESADALIEPLEQSVFPQLETVAAEVAVLRRREVTPERLGGADPRASRRPAGRSGGAWGRSARPSTGSISRP